MGERILLSTATLCSRRPWLVIAVSAALTVLAGWYSSYLGVDTSTDNVLAHSLPFKQHDAEYRKDFPKKESSLIIIDGPTGADADSAADNLAVRLRARPELFTEVEVPGESEFFTNNGLLYLAQDKLQNLLNQFGQAKDLLVSFAQDPSLRGVADIVEARARATNTEESTRIYTELGETAKAKAAEEERTVDWVSVLNFERPGARPGTRRFVLARPTLDNTSLDRAGPALTALNEEIKGTLEEEAEGIKMQVTGDPSLRQQEMDDAFSGAVAASSLSFILVALSLIFGIRSGRLILTLMIVLVVGGVWTTGLATLFVGSLNLISIAFMVLFFGLGVDFGTHMGLRFLEERKNGLAFEPALRASMIEEAPSIGLSTLCAALAFLSFVPTSYTGLAEFGIISALGMVVAFVVTFTLQPALMAVMPPKIPKWGDTNIGVGAFIKRFHKEILVVSAIVTVGALYAAKDARVDVNPLNLQDPKAAPVIAYRGLAGDPATSPYSLNVVAANQADADERIKKLEAIPGVEKVATANDFLPKDQEPKIAAIEATARTLGPAFMTGEPRPALNDAQLRQAFAALVVAAERAADTTPAGSDLKTAAEGLRDGLKAFADKRGTDTAALRTLEESLVGSQTDLVEGLRSRLEPKRVTLADLPKDVSDDWVTADGRLRLQIQPATDIGSPEAMEDFANKIAAVEPIATGVPASVTGAGNAIQWAFVEAILYTILAIALIVAFLRRRLSDVLLILAPLAVASIWTVGAAALLDLPFNFANVIVIPLLIGLGVAGSVHIVVRTRELAHENKGKKAKDRVDVLDTSTSVAVLVAQLNTVAAFATLAISHHRGLYSMGLLLGLSLFLVVIVCLVVLPAGLIALHRPGSPGEEVPVKAAAPLPKKPVRKRKA
jgi:hopanoid biosynthesis associated RND transporter like protein HpnN